VIFVKAFMKARIPDSLRRRWRTWKTSFVSWRRRSSFRTPLGLVRWGVFANPRAVSTLFGFDRGTPVDRKYIDTFLRKYQSDIRGRVLEIGDSVYARKYGSGMVSQLDVLHVVSGNPEATLVGNLESGEGIPLASFDCMILTQTLHCIGDPIAAVRVIRRALNSEGVALVTLPCLSPISRYDADRWGDYWRFTPQGASRLFGHAFSPEEIEILEFGNRKTSAAFLFGLAVEELTKQAFEYQDRDCPMILGIRARKMRAE
jgi:hypothetical protein